MAFDLMTRDPGSAAQTELQAGADQAPMANPDAGWAACNPDRMLALLFVAPRDCEAIDALYAA